MKKAFLILASAAFIVNAAMISFYAARSDEINILGIRQPRDVRIVNQINTLARADEYSYVTASFASSVTIGGRGYSYILWTQQSVTAAQAKKIIDYAEANTTGSLNGITYENTFVCSGNPYEWRAEQGRDRTLVFSRNTLRLSSPNILSSYAYGLYKEASEESQSATSSTTTRPAEPTTTHAPSGTQPEQGETSSTNPPTTTHAPSDPQLTQISRPTQPEQGETSSTNPSTTTRPAEVPTTAQKLTNPAEIPQLG